MPSVCVQDAEVARNPTEKLALGIGRLFRELMKEARRDATNHGINIPQLMAIRGLAEMGPTPTTFWADGLGFSTSAVSEMIDSLVKRGYAVRTHDTKDRRKVMISLSPKGMKLARETKRKVRLFWEERCRLLAPAQVESAADILSILSGPHPAKYDRVTVASKGPHARPPRAGAPHGGAQGARG